MDQYIIRKTDLTQDDIQSAVAIHRQEIGQGFLSSLGDKALELIFSAATESKVGVLLIACEPVQNRVCGFLLGALDTGAFYKDFLLKKSFSAFVFLLPKMLSFERVRKVFETLLYPSKDTIQQLPSVELLDIAVLREHQGTGLAQQLFHEFVSQLQQMNIRRFKITTGENLVQAQRFYEKLGAQRVASIEVHKGQKTFVYIYTVPDIEAKAKL